MGNPILDVEFAKSSPASCSKWWQIPWYMYLCSLSANVLVVELGMTIAWYSPSIGKLTSNDTNINPLGAPITTVQTSLLVTIPFLSAIVTNPVWAKLIDQIGRKMTMNVLSIFLIFSLAATAYATNYYVLSCALFVSGMCVNGSVIAVSVYNNDIANNSNRGRLGCLMTLSVPIGLVSCYLFGSFTSIKYLSLICTVPSVIHLLSSPFICESPVYLVYKFKMAEAIETLKKLKQTKDSSAIEIEIKNIKESIQIMSFSKQQSYIDLLKNNVTRKAVLLSYQLFCIEQFSGISTVLAYVGPIFNKAGIGWSGDTIGIIVGLTKLLATLVALFCIDRIGRRSLLLFSSMFCTFPLLLLGFSFYIKNLGSHLLDKIQLLPVILVTIFIVVHSVGLGSVPITYVGELFPNDFRATGVSFVLGLQQINLCIMTFSFPLLSEAIGNHWCFWINSVCTLVGFFSIYFTIPETKGKSFSEIQNILTKNNK